MSVEVAERGQQSIGINLGDGEELVITLGSTALAAGVVDYVYDGVADDVQWQAALNALPATGGRLINVSTVQLNFSATVTRAIDNVIIEGAGRGSYFTNDGGTALFTAGGNNWKFVDLRTDAGSLNMGATTGWMWTNVDDGTYYAYRSPYGESIFGDVYLYRMSKAASASRVGYSVTNETLTLGSAGSMIHPVADMVNAAGDATRDALGGNLNGAVVVDSGGNFVYFRVDGAWERVPIATESGVMEVRVIERGTVVTTGDAKESFFIPQRWDGYNLVRVAGAVSLPSSSGLPAIQIYNITDSVDMLSTLVTIDVGEKHSKDATTPAVIDAGNDDVAYGDEIRFDIDASGTGAEGLVVEMEFAMP